MLGTILGTVLVEQEGAWLLELVEAIRRDARSARADSSTASTASSLTADQQAVVLRAFGLYFQLANLAEQHHRLRRRREDAHDGVVARESLEDAFQQLAAVPATELVDRAATTSIRLVLTAHPTEATRRTVLLAHIRIADQLIRLDDPRLAPDERAEVEERLAEEVTLLWQTDEVRHDRLRITDEIRNGLWFFEHSLISAATDLLHAWRLRVPGSPPSLTFGSWIGGDMDGNPAAGPASIAEALDEARKVALGRYRDEVRELAVEIASTRSLVRISPELELSLSRDETALPEYAAEIGSRNELEPYRRKLSFMWWRLDNDAYRGPSDLLDDLGTIRKSLAANGGRRVGEGRVARLERMVELFGFHIAKLDLRLHARDLREPRAGRRRGGRRRACARGQRGPRHADRLRHVERGRRDRRCRAHRRSLSIVPLFETLDDLKAAPVILDELLGAPPRPR